MGSPLPSTWDNERVGRWLEEVGLPELKRKFERNNGQDSRISRYEDGENDFCNRNYSRISVSANSSNGN